MGSTQTVGADYIPFFVTDAVSSPPDTAALYSEKLIMLPQHFFPASHVRFEAPVASCAWRDGSEVRERGLRLQPVQRGERSVGGEGEAS